MNFFRKYTLLIFLILFIGLYTANNYFINNFKNLYKNEGSYAIGIVKNINAFGRSGHDFVYTFNVNGKKYKSVCSAGNLSSDEFNKYVGKSFLVIYLKSNIYNNRLYISVPVNPNDNEKALKEIVKNSYTKRKLDSVPYPGFFWENYF
ncbi:hypothetical protein SAMN06265171_1032 [Chryseobacterium rhizoplanae]|uniref:Uncharacterized protein n=1 Tax=Chryseobacterium rhizoplanae TaxID=1609531 RepID=A0A521CHT6_9FLAO|nr:hypothetical protein [Chryseobacterium rhizoplanae]SMO58301.1 hypothetical protein SAMN06265171_1032 [Chryseobacterium rhizoplanae]